MVLVTGGAGYIGSHVCKVLRQSRIDHVIFDNVERGHQRAAGKSPIFYGDLRDRVSIDRLFTEFQIDVVMHFAGYIEVGESVENPSQFYRNNVGGSLNLLEAMMRASVGKIVFSSTAAVYGDPKSVPIEEDHAKAPTNPYGHTKLMVEQMLQDFSQSYDLRFIALRYFNAAGSDPDCVLGEDHRPETHLIPRILMAAAGKTPGFKVFGTDYDTPDGTCVRDFVHVMDLAQAHVLAMESLLGGCESNQYNLGNGAGFSVRDVLTEAERVVDAQIPCTDEARRAGDPAQLVASSKKIAKELGWKPEYPQVGTMIEHAWKWMQEFPDGYDK